MYLGIGNRQTAVVRGPAMAGLFGCDVDPDDFAAENKVAIYPSKLNVWLVGRRRGEGPTVEKFVDKYLTDKVDTSLFFSSFPTPEIKKLPADPNKIRLAMSSYGKRLQLTTLSDLTYPVDLGSAVDFYQITFFAPSDAPVQIPWPLEGCAEKANWALSSALSDIDIVTGKPSAPVNSGTATTPMTAADVERQRQASLEALTASRGFGGGSMSLTTWLLIGGAGAAALWYAKGRRAHR